MWSVTDQNGDALHNCRLEGNKEPCIEHRRQEPQDSHRQSQAWTIEGWVRGTCVPAQGGPETGANALGLLACERMAGAIQTWESETALTEHRGYWKTVAHVDDEQKRCRRGGRSANKNMPFGEDTKGHGEL